MDVEINITDDYTDNEKDSMVKELEELGFDASVKVTLFKKSELVPPDIQLTLTFLLKIAVSAYVAGFFAKIGEDTWDHVKEGLVRLFDKKKDGHHPRMIIKIPITDSTFARCSIVAEDKEELKQALKSLPEFLKASGLRADDVDYFIPVYYNPVDKWFIPQSRSSEENNARAQKEY